MMQVLFWLEGNIAYTVLVNGSKEIILWVTDGKILVYACTSFSSKQQKMIRLILPSSAEVPSFLWYNHSQTVVAAM